MFIISEIFPQHGGSLETAEQMILQSKMNGASAVKVQLYPADMFGSERSYLELGFEDLKKLKSFADRLNIDLFATPFTLERLEWCMHLDLKYLKVASRMHKEDPALVESIMKKNKPVFVSIPHDYDTGKIEKQDHAIYLYCIPKYPTLIDEVTIPDFQNSLFSGISDHSPGVGAALFASAHGAQYLEKHFTLSHSFQNKTEKAHFGSMTAEELALIKKISREFEMIQGARCTDRSRPVRTTTGSNP